MFRTSRSAVLTAGALVAALAVVPGAAYAADTTTHLAAAAMAAELKAAVPASTAAAAPGWRAAMTIAGLAASGTYVVDPASGVVNSRVNVLGISLIEIAVAGRGTYDNLPDPESRKALRMIGRPTARYAFTPGKLNFNAYVKVNTPAPAVMLTDDTKHAGTRTNHDDGSIDYAFTGADRTAVKLHLDPAGVLTSLRSTESGTDLRLTYTYGPQHLTAPSAVDAVSAVTLKHAVDYLDMRSYVREAAQQAAAGARSASHGRTVKVSTVRKNAAGKASKVNKSLHQSMVKVRSTSRGARVYATNPWTHQTVSYDLKASGKKVTVTKTR